MQALITTDAAPDDQTLGLVLASLAQTRQAATVEAYRLDLQRCGEAIGGCNGPVATLRTLIQAGPGGCYRLLTTWVGAMRAQGHAQLTIHRRIGGVRAVLRHAQRCGVIAWRVALDRHDLGPAQPRRDTRGPDPAQVRAMLAAAAAQPDAARAARDGALLWLLAGCGLRSHEVRGLARDHLDLVRGEARILGKGRREREAIPLPRPAVDALRTWLAFRAGAGDDAPVFVRLDRAGSGTTGAARLGADGLNRIVHRLAAAAGGACWPHALRHSAITMAARRSNGNAVAVRAYARHSSLATSQRYIDDLDRTDLVRTTTDAVGAAFAAGDDADP